MLAAISCPNQCWLEELTAENSPPDCKSAFILRPVKPRSITERLIESVERRVVHLTKDAMNGWCEEGGAVGRGSF